MLFEWDEAKRKKNLAKHGVDLALAEEMDWANAVAKLDARKNYGEDRHIALGTINGRLYACVYTNRMNAKRIISLRKANRREEFFYEEEIEAFDE